MSNKVVTNLIVNPRLIYKFISATRDEANYNLKIGSYEGTDFYVCDGCGTGVDGRKAFSDLILFVFTALLDSTNDAKEDTVTTSPSGTSAVSTSTAPSSGSGKTLRMTPFIYTVPIR